MPLTNRQSADASDLIIALGCELGPVVGNRLDRELAALPLDSADRLTRAQLATIAAFAPLPTPLPTLDWTRDPRAVALLASCAARPPRAEQRVTIYALTRDTWAVYVGYRAEALAAIRGVHGERALAIAHRTGDYGPFHAWAESPTVEEAIDAAIAAAATMEMAA